MRVLRLLPSRGERPDPVLERLLLFLSGLIIYYIECCCLHFRYNQGNENNKCKRERWRADYAPSLGKFIQALEITLKVGNETEVGIRQIIWGLEQHAEQVCREPFCFSLANVTQPCMES